MPPRPGFRQGDVTKAVKGAVKAGLSVARVEIDQSGRIVVFAGDPIAATLPADPYADWKAKKNARHA